MRFNLFKPDAPSQKTLVRDFLLPTIFNKIMPPAFILKRLCPHFALFVAIALCLSACHTPAPPSQRDMLAEISGNVGKTEIALKEKPSDFVLPAAIKDQSKLSTDDIIIISLANNAELQEALSGLGIERGKMLTAAHIANPRLTFMMPTGTRQFEFLALHPIVDTLFIRPDRIKIAEKNARAYSRIMEEQCLDVILQARLLCAKLELANDMAGSLAAEKASLETMGDFHRKSFEGGNSNSLNSDKIKVDISVLELAIQQENLNRQNAILEINRLMGASQNPWVWDLAEGDSAIKGVTDSRQQLLEKALLSRPSIRALEMEMEAIAIKHKIAAREVWNFLIGPSDKEFGNSNASGWTLSVGLDLPIFNRNEGGKAIARAELEKALRSYESQRNTIAHEISVSLEALGNNQRMLDAFDKNLLPNISSYVQNSQKLVEAGRENLEVALLAQYQLARLKSSRAQNVYQYKCAYYRLERTLASSLADK